MSKSIIVLLAPGFEEIEAITIIDVLRRATLSVITLSILASKEVSGSHNIIVKADALLADYYNSDEFLFSEKLLENLNLLAVVLPGGMPGAKNLANHEGVSNLLKYASGKGKTIAAICAAPIALNKAELLKGVKYTCYPGFEKEIIGKKEEARVCHDANIYTANGPGSAMDFALALVEKFLSKEKANEIATQMLLK